MFVLGTAVINKNNHAPEGPTPGGVWGPPRTARREGAPSVRDTPPERQGGARPEPTVTP